MSRFLSGLFFIFSCIIFVMKVAIVIEKYNPLRGGAERSTMEMAEALTCQGCDVSIIAGKVENAEETTGKVRLIDLDVIAPRNVWFRLFDQAVAKYVSAEKFDIVHSITPVTALDLYQPRGGSQLNAIQQRIALSRGVAKLYKRLTAGFNRARAMRLRAELKLATGSSGPFIAVLSNYVSRQFTVGYETPAERVALIRNAVDVKKFEFPNVDEKANELRSKFDPDSSKAIFLFVSADPVRKGLSELIAAVAEAAKDRKSSQREILLLVVGGFKFDSYQKQAEKLGIEKNVVYNGKTREVQAFMKMADALVLPTWDDACSRVVMEALVAGIPAISTEFNGASELFDDGRYGLMVKSPADTAGFAKAMNTLADPAECDKMKANIAASDLKVRLSMDRHALELRQLYEKIIQGR